MSDGCESTASSAAASELHPDELPAAEPGDARASWLPDGEFRQVDPNYVHVEAIGCWIFTVLAIAGIVAALLVMVLSRGVAGWMLAGAVVLAAMLPTLLVWLSIMYPRWEYRHIRYAVSGSGIEIQKGIFWRHKINVPRSRIQHTDVAQGPLARRFGIADLQVYTAGTSKNQVDLEGLAYDTALGIRDYLVQDMRADDI